MAAAFAVVTGMNDGGSILSTGLKVPSVRALYAVLLLVGAMVVVPLFSVAVAQGFALRLVTFSGPDARTAVAVAVVSAVGLVLLLTRQGLPTSLTLALVGGLTGAGVGFGFEVSWSAVTKVLAVGACAPLVGGLLAYQFSRLMRFAPSAPALNGAVYRMHRVAFTLQSLAYASNDGQKILAVLGAFGMLSLAGTPSLPVLAASGLLFGIGVVLGLPKVARGLSNGVLLVRPAHAVSAEFASAVAVLGSAAVGVPVSMTQAIAGGLIGTGLSHGRRRIRWNEVSRIGLAWLITLPTSCLVCAGAAFALKGL